MTDLQPSNPPGDSKIYESLRHWGSLGYTFADRAANEIERLQREAKAEYDSKCSWIMEVARLRAALTEIAALPPYSRAFTAAQACVIARTAVMPPDERGTTCGNCGRAMHAGPCDRGPRE